MLWPLHESCGNARALRAAASAYALQATRHQIPSNALSPGRPPVTVRRAGAMVKRTHLALSASVCAASQLKQTSSKHKAANPARCIDVLDFSYGSQDQETPRRPVHEASVALAAGRPGQRTQTSCPSAWQGRPRRAPTTKQQSCGDRAAAVLAATVAGQPCVCGTRHRQRQRLGRAAADPSHPSTRAA